jgi:hypothetical protein
MWFDVDWCQPIDAEGRQLFAANTDDHLSGASARAVDMTNNATFPLQFQTLTDSMCFYSHLFLNRSAMTQPQVFQMPYLGAIPLSAVDTARANEYIAAGLIQPGDPELFKFVNELPAPVQMSLNQAHNVQFKGTKNVDAHGVVTLTYEWTQRSDLDLTPYSINYQKMSLFNMTSDPVEKALIQNLIDDKTIEFLVMSTCINPQTMLVQVVTEVSSYSWLNFLSDSGGSVTVYFSFLLQFELCFLLRLLIFLVSLFTSSCVVKCVC